MKKKSKKLIGLLGIALIVLTLCVGGYTYAKYRTEVKGGGQVDIAKWSFKVDESSQKIETIKLSDTVDETLLVNGKVAPGTKGEFTIDIDGTGTEVGINYDVKFANETNKPTNFVYTYNGEKFNSLAKVAEKLKGSILANDEVKTKTLTIGWQWDYETGEGSTEINKNDVIDTQEGIANLDYTFDVIVTGTQMPTE